MNIEQYTLLSKEQKCRYINNITINIGLRYFGGKYKSAKYLINHIINMREYQYLFEPEEDKNKEHVFIDAFAGGGKIGLSIPHGMFDKIIINDLDYAVYSYYWSIKEMPQALLESIKVLKDFIDEDMIKFMTYVDGNEELIKKCAHQVFKDNTISKYEHFERVFAGAMIYWVTQTTWMGQTALDQITGLKSDLKNKDEVLEKHVDSIESRINKLHDIMIFNNIEVTCKDYKELIESLDSNAIYVKYYDPPYNPETLFENSTYENIDGVKENKRLAAYNISVTKEDVINMNDFLIKDTFYIKSDYESSNDVLDNKKNGIYKYYLGSFEKGSISNGTRDYGNEYVWIRYDNSDKSNKYLDSILSDN